MKRFMALMVGLVFLCCTVAFAEDAATTAPAADSYKSAPAKTKKVTKKVRKKASKKAPKKEEKKDEAPAK